MKNDETTGRRSSATAWLCQGNLHREHKRHARAQRALATAARIAGMAGDCHTQSLALYNLGGACHALGQDDNAKRYYEAALVLQRELTKTDNSAWYPLAATQHNLADLSFRRGDLPDAHKRIDEALMIFNQYMQQDAFRHAAEAVRAMALLAFIYEAEGNLDSAVKHFECVVRGRRTLCRVDPVKHVPALAATLEKLAELCERLGHADDALRHREEAMTLRAPLPSGPGAATMH